jgi:hypothetical protein
VNELVTEVDDLARLTDPIEEVLSAVPENVHGLANDDELALDRRALLRLAR